MKAKQETAKQVFKELEKYFYEEGEESEYVILTADYFMIKAKFLEEKRKWLKK